MQFRILGPLEVEEDGRPVVVGGTRQRALLAVLLLHANSVVSRDRLIQGVWGDRPPDTAQTALQVYVSGLRKILGADRIVTRAPGYLLQADRDSIDLGRFETLVEAGKEALAAADAATASRQLAAALALWRGEPLADLESAPVAQTEFRRFEELRLGALEERVEADLALGRHAELIAELQALVRDHPFRERLRAQLMVALYRSGRQAEALEHYRQGRRVLAEELGLEPGEALRRLELAILDHDPDLGSVRRAEPSGRLAVSPAEDRNAQPAPEEAAPPANTGRRSLLGRPRLVAAVGGVLITASAAAIAITLTAGGRTAITVVPNSVAIVDAHTSRLVGDVPVGQRPVSVATGEGAVWVASADDKTISRIDPKTRKVVKVLGTGTSLHDLAVGFGSVWTANGNDGTVTRIDPKLNEIVKTLYFRKGPDEPVFWIATGAGAVWATRGNTLLRINPATDRFTTIPIPPPAGLAAGSRTVWVATTDQRLLRISAAGTARTRTVPLGSDTVAPAVGFGSLWLIVYKGPGQIWRIDPRSTGVSSTRTDTFPAVSAMTNTRTAPLDLTVGDGAVWAVDTDGAVLRIDPATARTVMQTPTAPTIRSALAVGSGDVWIAIQEPE
jgi:DNA-binding SARP family transcriptional activator/streptogramin lyase